MSFELMRLPREALLRAAEADILAANPVSERFGLRLSARDARELALCRETALNDYGRVEFGGGVIGKLIYAFCDSPYISARDYAKTLRELTELFYACKGETLETVSDDELIEHMRLCFDGVCQGSMELLAEREMPRFARRLKGCGDDEE